MFLELNTLSTHKPIQINVTQICSINGNVIKMSNQDIIELTKDSLKTLSMAIAPKNKQTKDDTPDNDLLQLFEQLHKLTGGKGKTVFSLQREKKLKDLLGKHRMTKELLIKAATNIGNNAFLQGENETNTRYGKIDYLLRPDKAAMWSEDQNDKKKKMF